MEEESVMSRTKLVISTFSLICVLSLGAILAPRLGAQEATPSGIVPHELAPGVTADVLGGVPSDRAPDQTVYTARFEFTPGSEIFPHSHPGTTSLTVVEGTFGWTLIE